MVSTLAGLFLGFTGNQRNHDDMVISNSPVLGLRTFLQLLIRENDYSLRWIVIGIEIIVRNVELCTVYVCCSSIVPIITLIPVIAVYNI